MVRRIEMLTAFLVANITEIICGGTFLTGFSIYSYLKLKKTSNKFKVQYCDVTDVIRQYKRLDKIMNESVGGASKNDKFFN